MKRTEVVKPSPSSPRLVLVVPAFPKLSETFIVTKFLGLLEHGWDVHVVCSHSDPKDWKAFPHLNVDPEIKKHVHVTWPQIPRWLAGLLIIPALVRGFARSPNATWNYLRKGSKRFGLEIFRRFYLDLELICLQPDIIHFEFGSLAVGRTHLKELLNCRISVSFRGYDLNFVGLDQPDYYNEVWNKADACHFLGEDLWQRAQTRGCPPDMPYMLIPPGVDLEKFPRIEQSSEEILGTRETPLKILSVGRLEWKKGYEFALSAMKILKDQGYFFEYRIVGEGEHRTALEFACHQLDIKGSVQFLGALPQNEVIEQLAWADVFLHPSISEGFCNAVLEAQAMGLPVVCTDAGGLAENVADGVTGFVVPRRDPKALAEKMTLLTENSDLRNSFGLAGIERVKNLFTIEKQLDAFEFFFQKLSSRDNKESED